MRRADMDGVSGILWQEMIEVNESEEVQSHVQHQSDA